MLVRVLSLLVGVPLLLVGLLATVIAVGRFGNAPQGAAQVVAQVIIVVLMAGIGLVGGWLVKWGLFKRVRSARSQVAATGRAAHVSDRVTAAPSTAATDDCFSTAAVAASSNGTVSAASQVATLDPPVAACESQRSDPDFGDPSHEPWEPSPMMTESRPVSPLGSGALVGMCGPKLTGQRHYYVIGGVELLLGAAAMLFFDKLAKPGDEATAQLIGLWLGGLVGLKGFVLIALQLLQAPQKITLYDDRLEEQRGTATRTIHLDRIASMRLQEFYEHRFAPRVFLVSIDVPGERKLKFSTALGGDGDQIVAFLADLVPDVQVREFMA